MLVKYFLFKREEITGDRKKNTQWETSQFELLKKNVTVIKSSNKRQSKHDREGKKMSRKLSWKTRRGEKKSANFGVDKKRTL